MQIAICDDEKSIGLILEEKIKKLLPDAVIDKYLSGDELIASGCEPDILFLDIQMPGMDGMETARILRQKNERMVLIFVTAVEEYVFQAFDVAAFHYLVKPFSDGTDLLALFKEKAKNGAGYELYSNRWLEYAKNGWKKENDLVLKIGFDSSGLYDIGQEKGYGAAQNMWMKGVSQSMFEARV